MKNALFRIASNGEWEIEINLNPLREKVKAMLSRENLREPWKMVCLLVHRLAFQNYGARL
jgi:hypothetical protein